MKVIKLAPWTLLASVILLGNFSVAAALPTQLVCTLSTGRIPVDISDEGTATLDLSGKFQDQDLIGTANVTKGNMISIYVTNRKTLLTVGAGAQPDVATLMVMQPTKGGVNFSVLCNTEVKP